eukprot:GHVT01048491.1.p3 GENE.GHVT01048491.1~~GHVT01048491.1.p3  ORF type:complete len:107 (+),score=6.69 GHVT01048491.1:451-771(+)
MAGQRGWNHVEIENDFSTTWTQRTSSVSKQVPNPHVTISALKKKPIGEKGGREGGRERVSQNKRKTPNGVRNVRQKHDCGILFLWFKNRWFNLSEVVSSYQSRMLP